MEKLEKIFEMFKNYKVMPILNLANVLGVELITDWRINNCYGWDDADAENFVVNPIHNGKWKICVPKPHIL